MRSMGSVILQRYPRGAHVTVDAPLPDAPVWSPPTRWAWGSQRTNKHLALQIVDFLFHGGALERADSLIAASYVEHAPLPGQTPGLSGLKQVLPGFWAAFPDLHFTVEDLIAEGDRVVVRGTATATHLGTFLGIPSTGERVRWTAIDIIRVAGGLQVEHWGNSETPELLRQVRQASGPKALQPLRQQPRPAGQSGEVQHSSERRVVR